MKRILLPSLFLVQFLCGHGITARCQDTTALDVVQQIASRVMRDTRFSFRLTPQAEELGMQVLDIRWLAPRGGEQVYARRTMEATRDTVIDIGIAATAPVTIWIGGRLAYNANVAKGRRPVEFAYDKFRFTQHFRAQLKKGPNDWLIRITAKDGQTVVFLRPQTPDGSLDSTLHLANDQWKYAGPFETPAAGDAAPEIRPFYYRNGRYFNWTQAPQRLLPRLEIDPHAAYRRESFADWQYPNGILLWTFLRLSEATGDMQYHGFVEKYAAFLDSCRPYFKAQYDSLFDLRGSYHRLFRRSMLDDAGAPTLPLLALYTKEKDTALLPIVQPMINYVCQGQPRLADSTFCRPEPQPFTVWADDLFMSTPFLLMTARLPGHPHALDDAARQAVNFRKYLRDEQTGLYHHGWYSTTGRQAPICWGRANGWIAWATAELLDTLSPRHPLYRTILEGFQQHMDALARYQSPDGFWHQVLDDPSSYEETSCTAMFALAMARGARNHWLDGSYAVKALKAWQAVRGRITADGVVRGICRGTDMSADAAYYKNRPTYDNDPRGLGGVIAAGIEIAQLQGARASRRNYLFDMGSINVSRASGYTAVTPSDHYEPGRGFGWLTPPSRSFDSVNLPLPQSFLKEGVLAADSLVFRVDLPDDDYFVTLTLGTPPRDTSAVMVSVNDHTWPDTVCTPRERLPYRTISKKIHISGGYAAIKVARVRWTNVGIYAIAIRPVTAKKGIAFDSPLGEDTAAVRHFRADLRHQVQKNPGNLAAVNQLQDVDNYLLACADFDGGGWSWAVKSTHMSLIYRMFAAADLLEQVIADPTGPLYERSLYLLARIYYWLHQEDDDLYSGPLYDDYFRHLQKKYPENTLIRMYLGEKFYDKPVFDTISMPQAPRWAILQHEAMVRLQKLIHWWVLEKQTSDGEMGGKYGDDVELLRTWLPAILGADDSIAILGYTRLADGVWNSDALEKGFARRIDDVEHSSELFRDTHPSLFLMHYGDPEYVERCLVSMQHFRDTWTGISFLGHRHFKSYYLSSTAVLADSIHGIDVALNARAVHPGLWAAWYNHNPTIIRGFSEWSDAWIADAQRASNGKPAGILPSAVSFSREMPGGNSPQWYDPHLGYDYYQWDHIGHVNELQRHLIAMYAITGERRFLRPLEYYAALMRDRRPIATNPRPGSLDWVRYQLAIGGTDHEPGVNPMGKLFAMARQIVPSPLYDSLTAVYGEAYNKYRVTGDQKGIEEELQQVLTGLRYNFPLLTSEVRFTDRVYVPGGDILTGMYTGNFGAGYEFPSLTATWKNTGPDIAIFVREGHRTGARVSLFNFGAPRTVTLRTWQLAPGKYAVALSSGGGSSTDTIDIKERVSDIPLAIPSGEDILVDIRQLKAYPPAVIDAADIALAGRDISFAAGPKSTARIDCRIHNIGERTARKIRVTCFLDHRKIGETIIPSLAAPNDLAPKIATVHFACKLSPGRHRIEVRTALQEKEITLLNNSAVSEIPAGGIPPAASR